PRSSAPAAGWWCGSPTWSPSRWRGSGCPWRRRARLGGDSKKKLTFKVKATDMDGAQRADVVISAQDARKLKATDQATNVLKNCKVVVIAGGDIAGARGAL